MDRLISISDGANLSGLYAAVPHENEHFPSVSPVSSCTGSCNKSKLNDTTVVTVQMGQMQADPGNPLLIFSYKTKFPAPSSLKTYWVFLLFSWRLDTC